MAQIASSNATNAAAPNPTLAAEEAISLGYGSGGGSSGQRNLGSMLRTQLAVVTTQRFG